MSRDGEHLDSNETPEVEPDTTSDPSLDDENGSDWADEGGATEEGPATDEDAS
ncbi:hypothetical protein [Nocardioides bruguierae]|uniref:Uncharacterized protein n=1 Tax=Nocardioides bruguierae TaxID=2945102 RepID=A0A9X2DBT5_9ACTN|nr:hypothetical protein [Nocardioides bruguierae]MCL8026965.1 hypothetical protein [Nocardioides bruguierae]MCM0622729.1 hypothetical protein [Nocardioides bruguierae]